MRQNYPERITRALLGCLLAERVSGAALALLVAGIVAYVGAACCGGTMARPERFVSAPAIPSLPVETYRCHAPGPSRPETPDVMLRATVRALGVELQAATGETVPLECMIVPLPPVTP